MSTRARDEVMLVNVSLPPEWRRARAPMLHPAPTGLVQRLLADERYREFLLSIGVDPAVMPRVVVLSELREAPPRNVPFFNDYTNVLTVPAPDVETIWRIFGDDLPHRTNVAAAIPGGVPDDVPDNPVVECDDVLGDKEHVPAGVELIEAPAVWKQKGVTGTGISVGVVDSGIAVHADLPTPIAARSFVPDISEVTDQHGHGTYMTGVILARRNKTGIVGVAPDAGLIVARVTNAAGRTLDSWIAAGISWCAARGAAVINVCVVLPKPSDAVEQAVEYASTQGAIVCAAAGNNLSETQLAWPAALPGCIAVGATRLNDTRCPASNWTPGLTIGAPGCPTLSTSHEGGTRCDHGSSPAAAHVSGVIALMLSQDKTLTFAEVRKRLRNSGEQVSGGGAIGRVVASRCVS